VTLLWEGATPDANKTTFTVTDPTAPRTITFKDETGTVAFLTDITGGSPLTTKGDLFGYDTGDARVPVGGDNQVLLADSVDAQGVSWSNLPSATVLRYQDDFFSGESPGDIGELGWAETNCTCAIVAGVANHPGLLRCTANGAAGSRCVMWLAQGSTSVPPMIATDIGRFTMIVRIQDITDVDYQFGFFDDADTAAPTDGVYFEFVDGVDTDWQTVTESGNVRTVNDTANVVSVATFYRFDFVRLAGGNWEFYLDGTLEFTHSTNLPTVGLVPSFRVIRGATDSDVDYDYFDLVSKTLTR
jgi:hypothetical protein